MINNWLVLISTLHCMTFLVLNAEPLSHQFSKRNPKFDVKKDSLSSYQEPDFFALDTLAGIGLGKRSEKQLIAVFQPAPINTNDHSFRFLGTPQASNPSTFFDTNLNNFNDISVSDQSRPSIYQQGLLPKRYRFGGQQEEIPVETPGGM